MLLIVGYEDEMDYVFGKIEGELTKDVASSYFSKVAKVAEEYNCYKVITDLRDAQLIATRRELEIMAKELKGVGLDSNFKRALLITENIKDYKVWENFNFHHGFKDIRLFSNEEVALEWIKQ